VDTPSIECKPLFHERFIVLIRDDHPLARARVVRLRQLANETLLMYERKSAPVLYDKILSLYSAAGVTPRIVHTPSTPIDQSGLMMVASGDGIYLSVTSRFTQPHAAVGVAELAVNEPNAVNPVLLAWRRDEASVAVCDFVKSAREVFPCPVHPQRGKHQGALSNERL
jgi:DNA-binding transcriptional LysR family regulator